MAAAAAAATAPAPPAYNKVRFDAYKRRAAEFVDGQVYDANEMAHMLHDIRHDEVPKAFAVALYHATKQHEARPNLSAEFEAVLEYAVFLGFGSRERALVQPWFLQNWDAFFVSCVDGLLNLCKNDHRVRRCPDRVRRAVRGLLALVGGARKYMSLDRLADSSAVHALLVAAGHTRLCFLKNGFAQMGGDVSLVIANDKQQYLRPLTLAHVLLMDEVAHAVLATTDRCVASWERAFGHYAGAMKWRAFAMRCKCYCPVPGLTAPSLLALERHVETAFARAREDLALEDEIGRKAALLEQAKAASSDAWDRDGKRKRREEELTSTLLAFVAKSGGGGGEAVHDFVAATPSPPPKRTRTRTAGSLAPTRSSSSESSSSSSSNAASDDDDVYEKKRYDHPSSPVSTMTEAEDMRVRALGDTVPLPMLVGGGCALTVSELSLGSAEARRH
jgi:hypothetical protein